MARTALMPATLRIGAIGGVPIGLHLSRSIIAACSRCRRGSSAPQRIRTIEPTAPVTEALKIMAREDVNQLPVVSEGRLEGVVTRSHILRVLESRAELRAA